MAEAILDLPAEFDAWTLSDWVERKMLMDPETGLSRTAILRAFSSGNEPDAAELDELFAELRRRADAAAKCYPFRVNDDGVITLDTGVDRRVYEFLVLLSDVSGPFRAAGLAPEVVAAFDLLVREAAACVYKNGRAVRFRAPDIDGRPHSLGEAFKWLADLTGAGPIDVTSLSGAEVDPGFDVVAWRPVVTGVGSIDRTIVQATVDPAMRREPGDLTDGQLQALLRLPAAPVLGLAVPFAVEPTSIEAQDLKERVDVRLLDRLTLCELLDVTEIARHDPEWRAMREFIVKERAAAAAEAQPTAAADAASRVANPFRRKTPSWWQAAE